MLQTALPVIVKNSSPLPVEVMGARDPIAIWTLVAAIFTLAAAIWAASISLRALKYTRESVDWAKRDYDISKDQAAKADAERTRQPNLTVTTSDLSGNVVRFSTGSPFRLSFELLLINGGPRVATNANIILKTTDGLTFMNPTSDGTRRIVTADVHEVLYEVTKSQIVNRVPCTAAIWAFQGTWGIHILYWIARSAEGSWPVDSTAPIEEWGQLRIHLTNNPLESNRA
jgi:hypothetical protein